MTRSRTVLALCAAALLCAPALHAAAPTPTAAVKEVTDKLRTLVQKYDKAQGPAKKKARDEARAAVASLLDFETLAQSTLGKKWGELKPAERTRYTNALRGAMEASYLSRMSQGGVDVEGVKTEFTGEEPKDKATLVKTRISSGKDTAQVDYVVQKEAKGFRAVDVITEGVSLAETYRDQINQLWPKKGFEGVVTALEKKQKKFEAELASGGADAKPSAAATK